GRPVVDHEPVGDRSSFQVERRGDEVAGAGAGLGYGQTLRLRQEVPAAAGVVDQAGPGDGVSGLSAELPDAGGLLADIEGVQFVVGHTTTRRRADGRADVPGGGLAAPDDAGVDLAG